jgi:hypothetical protein
LELTEIWPRTHRIQKNFKKANPNGGSLRSDMERPSIWQGVLHITHQFGDHTMTLKKHLISIAGSGLIGLAVWAPVAHAGHLNPVLETNLVGVAEVSSDTAKKGIMVGDPDARGTATVFGIDGAQNMATLCYAIVVNDKLAELTQAPGNGRAAHIHEGAAGSNGPVVAALAWPQNGQAGDCISEATEGKFPTKEAGIVQRILKNPQSFYINVHNSEFPAGAIRGQLAETPHVL